MTLTGKINTVVADPSTPGRVILICTRPHMPGFYAIRCDNKAGLSPLSLLGLSGVELTEEFRASNMKLILGADESTIVVEKVATSDTLRDVADALYKIEHDMSVPEKIRAEAKLAREYYDTQAEKIENAEDPYGTPKVKKSAEMPGGDETVEAVKRAIDSALADIEEALRLEQQTPGAGINYMNDKLDEAVAKLNELERKDECGDEYCCAGCAPTCEVKTINTTSTKSSSAEGDISMTTVLYSTSGSNAETTAYRIIDEIDAAISDKLRELEDTLPEQLRQMEVGETKTLNVGSSIDIVIVNKLS